MIRCSRLRNKIVKSAAVCRSGCFHSERSSSFLSFNDVHIAVKAAASPEKVPIGYQLPINSQTVNRHLRWLAQKDSMGQDVFLIGYPGPLRRRIAMQYAELTNREVEYLVITRDTTESDIKQRREIQNGRTIYVDQSAVKAAVNGSILLIDGVEKAERNILPILNNLLENREMQLDDGRFLVSPERFDQLLQKFSMEELKSKKLERVSEHFRVIALGLPVPKFRGNPLDPPIRSRFQSRTVTTLPFNEMFEMLSSSGDTSKSSTDLSAMLSYAQVINSPDSSSLGVPQFPEMSLTTLLSQKKQEVQNVDKLLSFVYPRQLLSKEVQMKVDDIAKKCIIGSEVKVDRDDDQKSGHAALADNLSQLSGSPASNYVPNAKHESLLRDISTSFDLGVDICLVGEKSSGKSTIARHLAAMKGQESETFMMYNDITARDLLQQRSTKANGDTYWNHSPLIDAALEGKLTILDGLHHIEQDTLPAIQSLVHDREVTLFDGTRLTSNLKFKMLQEKMDKDSNQLNSLGVFEIPESFRVFALAEPPISKGVSKWLNSEVLSMFHFHLVDSIGKREQIDLFRKMFPDIDSKVISDLCELSKSLRKSQDENLQTLSSCLSTKQIKRLLNIFSNNKNVEIKKSVESAFMPQFLPELPKKAFYEFIESQNLSNLFGLEKQLEPESIDSNQFSTDNVISNSHGEILDESLVPRTLFYENEEQSRILESMMQSFSVGEHLLIVGNQGVGKNKLVDKMLSQIGKPRQYIQLHRDTTVQALTVQPGVKDGKIVYEASPLIRAVKNGHALVIDEADKAPTHVTSILKGLVEDSFMYLSDGRKIVPESSRTKSERNGDKYIVCHPNFRMIVLANRPGFPFLGNDFFAAMGDLFSCHAIDNPGKESQIQMLTRYAPNVDLDIITRLIDAFDELRELTNSGSLSYPYSTRELVNIVKHLQNFPHDGIPRAIKNIFDFDSFDEQNLKEVNKVLKRNGFPVETGIPQIHMAKTIPLPAFEKLSDLKCKADEPIQVMHDILASKIESNKTRLKTEVLKMQTYAPRTEFFQEQSKIWAIPIAKSAAVSDMKALPVSHKDANSSTNPEIFLVSLFPSKLHRIIVNGSDDRISTNECESFDISKVFDRTQICTNVQLNFIRCEKLFNGNLSVACFSPQSNALLLVDPKTSEGKLIYLDIMLNLTSPNALNSVFRRAKIAAGSVRMLSNNSDATKLVFHDTNGKKIVILDFIISEIGQLTLPIDAKSVEFLSENELAIFDSENQLNKLSLTGQKFANDDSREFFMYKYDMNTNDSVLSCSDYFDSALVSEFLNNQSISTPAKLITGNRTQIGISLGFPDLDDGEIIGVPRNHALKNSLSSVFLSPSFASISIVDSRYVPKEHLPDHFDLVAYPYALEWINVRSKSLRYLPIPKNKYDHPMSSYLTQMNNQNIVLSSDGNSNIYTCDPWGTLRQWEVNYELLRSSYQKWMNMIGRPDEPITIRHSQREATGPKHGKMDATGNPHVGGNTWAGGSGGADTAGMGGIGGPYRLDLGHQVFQVPDEMKQNVPPHVLKAAKEMRDKAFMERLREIEMSEFEADVYNSFYDSVKSHINSVRVVIESLEAKRKDREWLKHQTLGEFDDTKIVDSILGEKSVYKRRGEKEPLPGQQLEKPKLLRLLCDVSGSMYRFNGYDQRLQRQMEAVCMVMEALKGYESKFKYDIYGHSGEDDSLQLVDLHKPPANEKERLQVLNTMHAHAQYCLSGDTTVAACTRAVNDMAKLEADERFLILFSDANFSRYGISPSRLAMEMLSERDKVNSFVIFIGSLGDEAELMKSQLPSQSSFVCMDTKEMPAVIRQILTSTMLK